MCKDTRRTIEAKHRCLSFMWCLSGHNRTPDNAARAQVAPGEFKVGKTQGNQRGSRNEKRYGEAHRSWTDNACWMATDVASWHRG